MSRVINIESMMEDRIKHAVGVPVRVFAEMARDLDNPGHQIAPVYDQTLVVQSAGRYSGSPQEFDIWKQIQALRTKIAPDKKSAEGWVRAAMQAPSQAELAALLGLFFVDFTRRVTDLGDLTSKFATETINPNFGKSVTIQEFYKYVVEFGDFKGTGESANQVQQRTGTTDTATIGLKAVGHQTTLEMILFNPLYSLQLVNQAVAEAYVDQRNAQIIAPILAGSYSGGQAVAAVQDAGSSYDVNLYQTIKKAVKAVKALIDPQTSKPISTATGINIAGYSGDLFDIERVVRGQLMQVSNGTLTSTNLSPLTYIKEMVEYDSGITHGDTYNGKTLSFPGFTEGYFYMYVPRAYSHVLTKRGLTMEAGPDLGIYSIRDSRLWYYAQGVYNKDFLGYAGGHGVAGQGAIVKVAMPDPEPST